MENVSKNDAKREPGPHRIGAILAPKVDPKSMQKNMKIRIEKQMFFDVFKNLMRLLTMPFRADEFYFGGDEYYDKVHALGSEISQRKDLKESGNARGSKHLVYINRTYLGLYAILNELNATITTTVSFNFEEQKRKYA